MKNIDISVIMGVYNEKIEWVEKAILSIINQTYTNFEFIVILDNPQNEELKNLISEFSLKDKRIKLYVNEENIGLINTLNKGLKLAKGKYIARMDADDISCGDRFEKQINFLEQNNNIVLVGGLNEYIDVLIPRGGENLIKSVVKNATIPVIETGTGNCHIYVDESADFNMAIE